METRRIPPELAKKLAEGKMFRRMECDRCHASYHFTESPRASRVPRCPNCGSFDGHPWAA